MKKLTVTISAVATAVLMAVSAQAAEIYNKDGNKLDLYGKVDGLHYFQAIRMKMVTNPTCVWGSRVKPRSTMI